MSLIFFAKFVLCVCPGFVAVIFPFIEKPIKAKSPITSNNLCLAASFLYLNFKLFKIPDSVISISFLSKTLAKLLSFLLSILFSTITIALFMSPPLIRLFSKSNSNSCKKQNVLEEAISRLKFFKDERFDFWTPKVCEL